jgi:type IV fimbrial biogenesis protein FimT
MEMNAIVFKSKATGFTMVELLVVLAIIGILGALAAPGFQKTIQRWRIKDSSQAMVASFYMARTEAMRRGGQIVLRKNLGMDAQSGQCPLVQDGDKKSWNCGWKLFWDANGDSMFDDGDTLVQSVPARQVMVQMNMGASSDRLVFDRWGQVNGLGTFSVLIYSPVLGISSEASTIICVNSGGRLRIEHGSSC